MNAISAQQASACIEVNEYLGTETILTGNAGIAVSERGTFTPDTQYCTLPIYPLQRDLPQLRRTGGAA
jgi:hypothetical protein